MGEANSSTRDQSTLDPVEDEPELDEVIADSEGVDDTVEEALAKAYMNDEASVLEVTAIRQDEDADEIIVEMETLYGDGGCEKRFARPQRPSLQECEALVDFLHSAGVSPMNIGNLVGTRVPAQYKQGTGWTVDESTLGNTESDRNDSHVSNVRNNDGEGSLAEAVPTLPSPRDKIAAVKEIDRDVALAATIIIGKLLVLVGIIGYAATHPM